MSDTQPTLQEHLREQLRMSRVSDRDRARGDGGRQLDDDGYFKATFDEPAALPPKRNTTSCPKSSPRRKLVQSLDPPGVAARTLDECLRIQLENLPRTRARRVALTLTNHLSLLANRDWARLQHTAACNERELHIARALIRSLDPRPGQRLATEARYVIPDVIVRKQRDRWVAIINPASLPRLRLNRGYDAVGGRNGSNQSLARHLQEARWLLRSIEQRRHHPARRRRDRRPPARLFEYGEVAMKPLDAQADRGRTRAARVDSAG